MIRVLDLALKDLYQIVRDWQSALFLIAMPIAFTLMFGFIFGGAGDGGTDARFPVGVLNLDTTDAVSTQFIALLDSSALIRPVLTEDDDTVTLLPQALAQQVADGELVASLMIPASYGAQVRGDNPVTLQIMTEANTNVGHVVQTEIQAVVARLSIAVKAAQLTVDALTDAAPDAYTDAPSRDIAFEAALIEAVVAWATPPFTVVESATGAGPEEPEQSGHDVYGKNSFVHSSAGMMAQFAIAGLIGSATVIVTERKSRTLQRMLTTTMSRADIIAGHFLATFVMVLVQLLTLAAFGQVMGVPYLNAPLASVLMLIAFAFFAAGLGMLIGALAKNEDQVVVYSLIPMFILSGLGGAWMPLEFTPQTFQTVAHLTPLAWAVDGLKDITIRGVGATAILQPFAILIGFGLACLAVAVWQFRTE